MTLISGMHFPTNAKSPFQQEQRGRILGLIGSIVAAGTLLGPAIGGLLTDAFGWRSIFLINLPVGLLGVIGTCVFLPAEPRRRALIGQLDLPGVFLFGGFTASLLLGLGIGPGSGWSSGKVLCLLAATALFLLLFIGWESRAARPLIDIRLFRRRVFGLGTLAAFLSYILMLFPAFFLPLYLHEVLGWSIGTAGLLMTIQAIAMLLVAPLSGWWSDRAGSRHPALVALGMVTLAMSGTAFLGPAPPSWFIGLLLSFFGIGVGLFGSPNSSALVGDLGHERAGTATGIIATLRNFGRAIGVAVAVLLYQAFAGTSATAGIPSEIFLVGFRGVFLVGALLGSLAFVAVIFMYRPKPSAPPEGYPA